MQEKLRDKTGIMPELAWQNQHNGNKGLREDGVADGARTHDNRNHNPGLYQLSYSHH
jgi:hypothetical protein